MNAKDKISHAELLACLVYSKRTGLFRWRDQQYPKKKGWFAGTQQPHGYLTIVIAQRKYYAHTLAWFYVHKLWPVAELDHKDTNRANNKFRNLREDSLNRQRFNTRIRKDNISGVKGVHWMPKLGKWRTRVGHKHVGVFFSKTMAAAAYLEAAKKVAGEFARLSRR